MKMVSKALILFFLLSFSYLSYPCALNPKFNYILLSSPLTQLLFDLNLLKDKQLKIISQFAGIEEKYTSAEVVVGGINISPEFLKQFDQMVIFFDESNELQKIFTQFQKQNQMKVKQVIKIITKDKDPFIETRENIKEISPYLVNCEKELIKIAEFLSKTETELIKLKGQLKSKQIFFLGEIDFKYEKKPPLLMVNDGPVLYLLKNDLIKSYDSPLSYPSWSSKVLKELELSPIVYIGLNGKKGKAADGPRTFEINRLIKNKRELLNIYNSGLLVPGISQVYFLQEWNKLALSLTKF
ncbi:MAG: hypothetical protein U0T83_01250 [Bacteriovoracaceae bacterium]